MIFVAVGTHEQPMDRLINEMDYIATMVDEQIIVQYGESRKPQFCVGQKTFSHSKIEGFIRQSRIVVTHGGPGLILETLSQHKSPVVVPRLHKYGEHVDDHQLRFTSKMANELPILLVAEIHQLRECILNYEELSFRVANTVRIANKTLDVPSIFTILDQFVVNN